MSVAKKGRRHIEYHNKNYVWWVAKDEDNEDKVYLNIVSEDKKIVLSYRVDGETFFVISKGRMFQGESTSGCAERYWYPMTEPPMIIKKTFVLELIKWATDGRNARKVILKNKEGEKDE